MLSLRYRHTMTVVILVMGAIAAYGFAFLVWTKAIAGLTTAHYSLGTGWAIVSLLFIGSVICSLQAIGQELTLFESNPPL
jgi:hypothetical protein